MEFVFNKFGEIFKLSKATIDLPAKEGFVTGSSDERSDTDHRFFLSSLTFD